MAIWLRQSTAVTLKMGPFVDSVDADTEEPALVITQPDVMLSKNGGAFTQRNAVGVALVYDVKGWYACPLDTVDTNTLGSLLVSIHEGGALYAWREFMVIPALIYDGMIAGSTLASEVTTILGLVDPEIAQIKADTTAILADTGTNLDADLAALQATANAIKAVTDSLVVASGRIAANMKAIDDSTTAAAALSRSARTIVLVTVGVGSTDTIIVTSSLVPPAVIANQFMSRVLLFDKDTATTSLRGQGARIASSTSGGVLVLEDNLTTVPASGDTGAIV